MDQSFKLLATYVNPVEANIVKGRLASADIYSFLAGENFIGLNPLYSNMAGGVRVFVRPEDYETAYSILQQDREAYRKNICCEVCGSNEVHLVSTKKDFRNWIAFIASALLFYFSFFIIPFYIKKVYKCDVCKYETDNLD